MKKVMIMFLLLCGGTIVSQDNGRAIVCFDDDFCMTIERVKIDGVWYNACCDNVGGAFVGCTDDCEPPLLAMTDPPSGFDNSPAHFALEGNDVWIIDEDDELSEDIYENSSQEYSYLMNIKDFNFLDNIDELEFISIAIEGTENEAVIKKNTSQVRKRKDSEISDKERNFFAEAGKFLEENYTLILSPNPAIESSSVAFKSREVVTRVEITNLSNGEVSSVEFSKLAPKRFGFQLNSKYGKGVYHVKVTLASGITLREKLIIN